MTAEQCKQRLLELQKLPGNNECADCHTKEPPPNFVSLNLGLFVCIGCSGKHRNLGVRFSVIKSIHLDTFDDRKCQLMENGGNNCGAKKWEFTVPRCWPRPVDPENDGLIEQWIRAKYERQEFVDGVSDTRQPYAAGAKYGWLYKKEKKGGKWNKRFFVLSAQQGYFSYFLQQEDSEAKQRVQLSNLNVMFIAEEHTLHKHCLLITFPFIKNGFAKPRHIYAYADNSFHILSILKVIGQTSFWLLLRFIVGIVVEIVDWYLAIRAARLKYLEPFLLGIKETVVNNLLSRSYIKMGYLYKTGSKSGDGWRKRFVCIDIHRFMYFDKVLDAEPLSEIPIDTFELNCFVMEGVDGNHPSSPTNYCFLVHTQEPRKGRKPVFNFCAETREGMLSWLAAFRQAMKPLEWIEPIKDKRTRLSLLSNISTRTASFSNATN